MGPHLGNFFRVLDLTQEITRETRRQSEYEKKVLLWNLRKIVWTEVDISRLYAFIPFIC